MPNELNGAPLTPGQAEAQKQQQNSEPTRPDPPFPFGPTAPPVHETPPAAAPPPAPAQADPAPEPRLVPETSSGNKSRFNPEGYLG